MLQPIPDSGFDLNERFPVYRHHLETSYLHYAVLGNNMDTFEVLIKNGARITELGELIDLIEKERQSRLHDTERFANFLLLSVDGFIAVNPEDRHIFLAKFISHPEFSCESPICLLVLDGLIKRGYHKAASLESSLCFFEYKISRGSSGWR